MTGNNNPIPAFASEAEERRFWERHDSSDFVDWSKAKRISLSNLNPSTTSISTPPPDGPPDDCK